MIIKHVSAKDGSVVIEGDVTGSTITIGPQADELAELVGQNVQQRLNELVHSLAASNGIPIAPLEVVLAKLGKANVPLAQIPAILSDAADRLIELERRMLLAPTGGVAVSKLREKVIDLINQGSFDEADTVLDEVIALCRASRQETSANEAKALYEKAALKRISLYFEESVNILKDISDLCMSFDKQESYVALMLAVDTLEYYYRVDPNIQHLESALDILNRADYVCSKKISVQTAFINYKRGFLYLKMQAQDMGIEHLRKSEFYFKKCVNITDNNKNNLEKNENKYLRGHAYIGLGSVLYQIGSRTGDFVTIERAKSCFEYALLNKKTDDVDTKIDAQNGIGSTSMALARMGNSTQYAKVSVEYYRLSLADSLKNEGVKSLGVAFNNHAVALLALAEITSNRKSNSYRRNQIEKYLDEAIKSYRMGAKSHADEENHIKEIETLCGLSEALNFCDSIFGREEYLQESISIADSAREKIIDTEFHYLAAKACNALANAQAKMAVIMSNIETLNESIGLYSTAINRTDKETSPIEWARFTYSKGNAILKRAKMQNNTEDAAEAIRNLEDAYVLCKGKNADLEINISNSILEAQGLVAATSGN